LTRVDKPSVALAHFRADRARYPTNAWLTERSLWAVAVYRFGQAVQAMPRIGYILLRPIHRALILTTQVLTNIEIATRAEIGPGLRIHHAGPVVIGGATIGADCTMRVGNIIGNRARQDWPVLGDRVTLGAGAQVLGNLTIGDDVTVGAMSLVLQDVPAGAVVAGVPARTIAQATVVP
jgi:serine O-acetyltransferase